MGERQVKLLNRFFSERAFPLVVKLLVFTATLVGTLLLALAILQGYFSKEEARLILYVLHLTIFATTFFCGFHPGIIIAGISSLLAIRVLGSGWLSTRAITFEQGEIFPFVALYFLVAITVDWFREHIETLKKQLLENERLHEQTRHMEQLALAGEIAAGIAHEIRNPITVVHGYIQLLGTRHKELNESEPFALVLDELKRANRIISEFLRFSRPTQLQKEEVQLNQILDGTTSLMLSEALRKNVKISTSFAEDVPTILLDRSQMVQVFMNLYSNALQAMPNGGTLTVSTRYDHEQEQITVTIEDNGIGMPKETLQRIFTPFFTTREQGTGLGLAITQTIILSHDGRIEAESIPGQGTIFTVTFPVLPLQLRKG
ncbi:MAG: ATP-binding protein [Firmicutes bacterium]|nr:ATP-binding protein [Bacillota bacterium]